MAIDKSALVDAIVANLKLGGRDETAAVVMAEHGVRLAAKMVWRGYLWSFSITEHTLTMVADQTSGYALPDGCQSVLGARRTTSDDYGWKLVPFEEYDFDRRFPYPAANPANPVSGYKVGYDKDTQKFKLYTYPKSDDTDSVVVLYRMGFNDSKVWTHFPDDFEPLLMIGAMYHSTPVIDAQQVNVRGALFGEFRELLNEYKKRDAIVVERLADRGAVPNEPWALGSWQYIVAGGPYGML